MGDTYSHEFETSSHRWTTRFKNLAIIEQLEENYKAHSIPSWPILSPIGPFYPLLAHFIPC